MKMNEEDLTKLIVEVLKEKPIVLFLSDDWPYHSDRLYFATKSYRGKIVETLTIVKVDSCDGRHYTTVVSPRIFFHLRNEVNGCGMVYHSEYRKFHPMGDVRRGYKTIRGILNYTRKHKYNEVLDSVMSFDGYYSNGSPITHRSSKPKKLPKVIEEI